MITKRVEKLFFYCMYCKRLQGAAVAAPADRSNSYNVIIHYRGMVMGNLRKFPEISLGADIQTMHNIFQTTHNKT